MKLERREFLRAAALTAGGSVVLPGAFGGVFAPVSRGAGPVSFDAASLMINGKRELLISGEMHYARSVRAMWPSLLDRSRDLGLNCIASYVFWNVHEPQRGVFDFRGEKDLAYFLSLCAERGLHVFLRVGPYCCAEWNYGGYPEWLRDEPGITFRTMSQPYLDRVELYFHRLADVVRPYLATNGGPVILVQVENEYKNVAERYGASGQEYLRWIVEVSKRVGFNSVPATTCEGGVHGAIETANGDDIPAEHVAELMKRHPGMPVLWSELYPAWYQLWAAKVPPARTPPDIANAILSFVGAGGSGWNYYMWHGGTNFGRTSMYLQTTSYSFEAPLDEYGRETSLSLYLAPLHRTLREHAPLLLSGKRERSTDTPGVTVVRWVHGKDSMLLLSNDTAGAVKLNGQDIPAKCSRLLQGSEVLFDSEKAFAGISHVSDAWEAVATGMQWSSFPEPAPGDRKERGIASVEPMEQLLLTHDVTDYCWYSTVFESKVAEASTQLVIPYGGDFFYVFVDGVPVAKSEGPFYENRGPIVASSDRHPLVVASKHDQEHVHGYRHEFALNGLTPGDHELDLLCVSLGLIKGDWQIGYSMDMERKGIWAGAMLNGEPLQNWTMRPFLAGEIAGLPASAGAPWQALQARPLTWHRADFLLSEKMLGEDANYRLDADTLGKGHFFINGYAVGRYWLVDADVSGKPSQRYYHVPRTWLKQYNVVVVFEEQEKSPAQLTLQRRVAVRAQG